MFSSPPHSPNGITSTDDPITKGNYFEFVKFQRKIFNQLGFVGITTTRIFNNGPAIRQQYELASNSLLGATIYWLLYINVMVKAVFLAFLVADYFGPVEFLDRIATLDNILCVAQPLIGSCIFLKRYPFYEILEANWKHLNSIYYKHGCPEAVLAKVQKTHRRILILHVAIIVGGCSALLIQYFPDPKYCNFTYSAIEQDNWFLRGLFGIHEFFFMMMAWNGYAGLTNLSIYQGVAISALLDEMNLTLRRYCKDEMSEERALVEGKGVKFIVKRRTVQVEKKFGDTEYDIDTLIADYRQLMFITTRLNADVSYKALFLQICAGSQWVSDVYAATHVLRLPGTGILDIWFYIWDCMSAGFMGLRMYHFMGLVYDSAEIFLDSLREYLIFPNAKRFILRKVMRTLKIVSLNVGPSPIRPESLLTVMDTLLNYYICAALW